MTTTATAAARVRSVQMWGPVGRDTARPTGSGSGPSSTTRMVLSTTSGHRVAVPYAPVEVTRDGAGQDWVELDRAARRPLLVRGNLTLAVLKFTLQVQYRHRAQTIGPVLDALDVIYALGDLVSIEYSSVERGLWRMTGRRTQIVFRSELNDEPLAATVDLEFTQDQTVSSSDNPYPWGASSSGVRPSGPVHPLTGAPVRTYTVPAGDSLYAIAARFYGDGDVWPAIADANGIADARHLSVGARLTLPLLTS